MNGITGPGNLPGAEVGLAALQIKVGEERTQQQSNNAGDDYDTGSNIIHEGPAKISRVDLKWKLGRKPMTNIFTGQGVSTTGFKYSVLSLEDLESIG
jgi:hypothetical protein